MANFLLGDNQKVSFAVSAGLDAKGNPGSVPAGDTISVASSDVNSITIVLDATPATGSLVSGFLVAGSKLGVGVTVTATALLADGTPDSTVSSAVATIDVVGGVSSSLGIALGSPIFQ